MQYRIIRFFDCFNSIFPTKKWVKLIDLKKNTCYNVKNIFCRARICVLDVTKNDLLSRYLDCESETPAKNKKTKREKLVWRFL